MEITDLDAFRTDIEQGLLGKQAIFYEGNCDYVAIVRLEKMELTEVIGMFRFEITNPLGLPPPPPPLTVGGRWEHVEISRTLISGSGIIGGWKAWFRPEIIEAVVERDKILTEHAADETARLRYLKQAYRDAMKESVAASNAAAKAQKKKR